MRNLLMALILLTLLLGTHPVVGSAAPAAEETVSGRLDGWPVEGGFAGSLEASPSGRGATSSQSEGILGNDRATAANPDIVASVQEEPQVEGAVPVVQDPDIRVDPAQLSETLLPDEQRTVPLYICNDGTAALEWTLDEMEVLWDNGPLVTHPGGGYGGADASVLQTDLGMSNYAFGHQAYYGNRVADDFDVDGWWSIDQITFFAYQTNSPTDPSTFTAYNLAVWDGPPGDGGSIIWGDYVTNCMIDTGWMGAYRVKDNDVMGATRPIMANVCQTPGLVLPPGQYWLDWQADGTLSSGPWAPPVTILGETTTGDGLQSLDNGVTFAPVVDGGTNTPQGFPFVIEGTRGVPDVPWLSEDPTSGTVPPGECQGVGVTFDATGLGFDVYTCALLIASNDPDDPEVSVPVTLSVTGDSWVFLPLTVR